VDTDLKRQAQAQGARDLADAIRGASPWIAVFITGDMNDDPGSASSRIFFDDGQFIDLWSGLSLPNGWTLQGRQHLPPAGLPHPGRE
jgi:hypothetical protein